MVLFFFNLLDCCAGGLLLSVLATTSTILDHYLRRINEGYAIGLTSVLIIVSSWFSGMHSFFLRIHIFLSLLPIGSLTQRSREKQMKKEEQKECDVDTLTHSF